VPDPATIQIRWVEKLYSAQLKSDLLALRSGSDKVEAVVCKAFGWEYCGIIEERYYEEGSQLLVATPEGYKIEDILSAAEAPLRVQAPSDHLYRQCLPSCDVDGLCWRVFLHLDFVLVLPARDWARENIGSEALILLEAPQSNHEKLDLAARVTRIRAEVRTLFSFAFPDGLVLEDHEGFLPEDFA